MSLDNTKDESQTAVAGASVGAGYRSKTSAQKPPEQTLKCPRCESPNTKFCYYNNYSLTQPRHFCKTCRRYWTKGGALRNIPIGGGCRKKKTRSSSSRFMNGDSFEGLSLFSGLSPPAMDFQLGGLKQNPPNFMNLRSLWSSFPLMKQDHNNINHQLHLGLPSFQETCVTDDLSSMESLSSINQELHWKLQQQNPFLFQNLETEWFFDGGFAPVGVDPTMSMDPADSNIAENYENGSMNRWNNGIQGWDQFNQYTALP